MNLEKLSMYDLIQKEELPEINSIGYYLKHKKSGAKLAVLENDDRNKVFSISFRTPPKDDTGVAHIMEHSVLNGSERYPVKDPFTKLAASFETRNKSAPISSSGLPNLPIGVLPRILSVLGVGFPSSVNSSFSFCFVTKNPGAIALQRMFVLEKCTESH